MWHTISAADAGGGAIFSSPHRGENNYGQHNCMDTWIHEIKLFINQIIIYHIKIVLK